MKKYNCLVVDDEPMAIEIITKYIKKVNYLNLLEPCSNALDALDKLKSETVDLLFLDIQMPHITGLELIKMLKKQPQIILTTAYKEYAYDGFELDIEDYLLKPISYDRFLRSLNKAFKKTDKENIDSDKETVNDHFKYVFIKSDKQMKKIFLEDILFIEGLKDYIQITTKTEKIITYLSLKYLYAKLPSHLFLRSHKSFIVNITHIVSYNKTELVITNYSIPIGRHYKQNVINVLTEQSNIL